MLVATVITMVAASAMAIVIGVLAPFLADDAGLSVLQIGTLPAAVYGVASLCSPAAGAAADRLGARRAASVMIALSAAGFVLLGLAPSYPAMLLAMCASGLGLALSNPATNRIVVAAFPPGRRGVALGWKQSGVPIAAFLAGLLVPAVGAAAGWRVAALATAAGTLALGLPAMWPLRRVPDAAARPAGRAVRTRPGRVRPPLRLLNPMALLMGLATGCISTYLVLYGVQALGQPEPVAGVLSAVVGVAGTVTRVVWSPAAERGRGPRAALRLMAPLSLSAAVVIAASPYVGGPAIWIGALLAGAGIFAFTSLGMLALMGAVPEEGIGAATGSMSRSFFAGLLLGPPAFGLVVEVTGAFVWGWLLIALVLVAATVTTRLPGFLQPVDRTGAPTA